MVGMWKAFAEMSALGWIDPARRPHMVTVQAAGCAPIVRAFAAGAEKAAPWENAHTIADGLRVPKAIGDFLVLRAVRESDGAAVAVGDAEMVTGMRDLGRLEGISAAPEGGAALHALRVLVSDGRIKPHDRVVLFNTGGALKYLDVLTMTWHRTPAVSPMTRSMIGILFTGGTISMKLDPATGAAVPALGAADILAQVPGARRRRRHRSRRLLAAARAARHARTDVAARAARRGLARAAGHRRPRHHARHRHDRGDGVPARPGADLATSRSCSSARCGRCPMPSWDGPAQPAGRRARGRGVRPRAATACWS